MKVRTEKDRVLVFLEGRIDSTNADEIRCELTAAKDAEPELPLVIDAGELQYISSAGLRVLMQLAKRQEQKLTLQNVSAEVYEILEMTGFTKIFSVSRRMREISVDGCDIVGRGALGTVYRLDADTVVKVYEDPDSLPMIENEQTRARQAFLKGVPTAISYDVVKVGGKYGSVFEMIKASTLNDELIAAPERRAEIVELYARFIRQIHQVEMEPGELPEAKTVFLDYLTQLRSVLGEGLYVRLRALFEVIPENLHLIHGDIQMKNVMLNNDEPMLIDMDTLSVGDPVFDLMGLYVAYPLFNEDEPDNSQRFLGISGEMCDYVYRKTLACYFSGLDEEALREAEEKIRIVAYVRFLYLIDIMGIGKPELKQPRIDHTLAHLQELAFRAESLQLA